jgi:hypothetical protein
LLVRAHQGAADEGRLFAVHGPSDQVLRIFQITGLANNGLVFETRAEALSASVPAS